MRRLSWIPGTLFVIAVPLFLVCASVAWAVNDPGVYRRGFGKYHVADYSGISEADLRQVGAQLRRYFNSSQEPLAVRTRVFGREQDLFNGREVQHMRDVKRLFWGVYAAGAAAGAYLAAMTALVLRKGGRGALPRLARLGAWGGGLTVGLVLAVGLFSLAGFSTLFLLFHRLSFANDLWQLDPRTDYLVVLFPLGFWFDATLRVAATALAGGLVLMSICAVYLFRGRRARTTPAAN
jgi:integral membrane protein (TIGR01906 family)